MSNKLNKKSPKRNKQNKKMKSITLDELFESSSGDRSRTCENCENCLPIGEGDHFCDVIQDIVLADYAPTENYLGCDGKGYVEL